MEAIKAAGSVILFLVIIVALTFVGALSILGAASVSGKMLPILNAATIIGLIICVVVFLPLSILRATRFVPVWGFLIASYIFGVDAWMVIAHPLGF